MFRSKLNLMSKAKLLDLFKTRYPIVQGGMVWVSGAKLAAAASNSGCLGLIGAGSMNPALLKEHLQKVKGLTKNPFGVNIPLLYHGVQEQIEVALKEGVKIFFTSAGSPNKFTPYLKKAGCIVVHVTSSPKLAKKCEAAGCDAVVAEGFEAGGHNGRDEISTISLIPQVVDSVGIPVIAAGGIGDARSMAAAFCLGASAVQMGTRFLMTSQSSAHKNYKDLLLKSQADSTELCMKDLVPVRLFKNKFYEDLKHLENNNASPEKIKELLGKGRAKKGMLLGELCEGELEVGQICSLIKDLPSCQEMIEKIIKDYQQIQLPSLD